MKERTWLGILLSFAAPCRGKMAASVVLAILSVAGGFVPYLGVYQIIRLFLERQASWEGILFWCGVCLAGYAVKVAGYALSTMLAHVSAYTILEGLRLQACHTYWLVGSSSIRTNSSSSTPNATEFIVKAMRAVSYTHLDVYKRQLMVFFMLRRLTYCWVVSWLVSNSFLATSISNSSGLHKNFCTRESYDCF